MSARLDPFNLEQQEELLTPVFEHKKQRRQRSDYDYDLLYPENVDLGFQVTPTPKSQNLRVQQQQQQQERDTQQARAAQSDRSGAYPHSEGSFFEAGAVLIIIVGVAVVAGKLNGRFSHGKKRRNIPPIANRINPKKDASQATSSSSQISTAHSRKQKKQQPHENLNTKSDQQCEEVVPQQQRFCYVYELVHQGKCHCKRFTIFALQYSKQALETEVKQLCQGSSKLLFIGQNATQAFVQNVRQVSDELRFYVRNKLERLHKFIAIIYKLTQQKGDQKKIVCSPSESIQLNLNFEIPHSLSQVQNRKKILRIKAKPENNDSVQSFSQLVAPSTLDSLQLPSISEEQLGGQKLERDHKNCNCIDEREREGDLNSLIVFSSSQNQDSNQNQNFNCEGSLLQTESIGEDENDNDKEGSGGEDGDGDEDGWVPVLQGGKTSYINPKSKNRVDVNSQLENNHRKQRDRIEEELEKEQEDGGQKVVKDEGLSERKEEDGSDCLHKEDVEQEDVDNLTVTDDFSDDFVPQTPPLASDISEHAASSSYESGENIRVLSEDSESTLEGHQSPQAVLQWIGGGSISGPPSINSSPPPSQEHTNYPCKKTKAKTKTKFKNPHDFPTPRKNHKKCNQDNDRLMHQVRIQQQTYNQWLHFYEKENQYQQWLYWNQQQQVYQIYWQQQQSEAQKQYQIWYQHQKQQQIQFQQQQQQHQKQMQHQVCFKSSQGSQKVRSVGSSQQVSKDNNNIIHKCNKTSKHNNNNFNFYNKQKFLCEQKDNVIPCKQQVQGGQSEGGQGTDFRERLFSKAVRERCRNQNCSFGSFQSQNEINQLMQQFQSFGPGKFR